MKNNMKKIVSLTLAAGMLAGCTTGALTVSAEEAAPAPLKLTRTLFFGDVSDYPDLKEEWPKMVEEKYGVPVVVNNLPRNDYIQKVNLGITSGELDGLVSVFGINDVVMYKDQGAIEPLDEYLEDNEVWNSLPEGMKDMYKIDGHIWALPGGYQESMFTRTMRKDWLDNLGLAAPTNVDELYEVSKQFTFNDPDGNGKDDTYGITASGTWNLQDIFQAFGARLDNAGEGSIVYDPNDNAFVDSMCKPEMVEALTYLNKMYSEGILDPELFTNKGSNMREKFWAGEYGSTFYWIGFGDEQSRGYLEKITEDVEFVEIPYLEGKIDKNINHAWYGTVPYIMISGTENAGEMVDAYVNTFLGNEEGYLDAAFGIKDKTYRVDGDTVYTMIDETTGAPFKTPGIVSITNFLMDNKKVVVDGQTEEEAAKLGAISEFKHNMIQGGLDAGKVFSVPDTMTIPSSETYGLVQGDIKAAFDTCVSSAITGSVPVEDAIAKYREDVKSLGGQQILDETNEALGLTGVVTY